MIEVLVGKRVRIKIRIRVRVRVGVTFNVVAGANVGHSFDRKSCGTMLRSKYCISSSLTAFQITF